MIDPPSTEKTARANEKDANDRTLNECRVDEGRRVWLFEERQAREKFSVTKA